MTYLVKPDVRRATLHMTFTTPLSHHDPATASKANVTSFLRRKQVVERSSSRVPDSERVQRIIRSFPVPESLEDVFRELTVPEFLASAAVMSILRVYNGQGLLEGKSRYSILQSRTEYNATKSGTMFAWWGGMVRSLQGDAPYTVDDQIAALISIPAALAQLIFVELIDNAATACALARMWNEASREDKHQNHVAIALDDITFNDSQSVVLQVPAFSANSVRHEIIREPGGWHLLNALGLRYADLPDGVAALLYNGGDLNSASPSNEFALRRQIREAYPLLSLVGGSTSGFILGESNLEVSAWLVCKENAKALEQFGVVPEVSAFDLLDEETQTRHTTGRVNGSPMPYSFETLISGSELVVDLRLRPYANDLEIGALVAAIDTFYGGDGTLGGQSARGFGLTISQMIKEPSHDMAAMRQQYEAYLAENREMLVEGLQSGELTTGKQLFK